MKRTTVLILIYLSGYNYVTAQTVYEENATQVFYPTSFSVSSSVMELSENSGITDTAAIPIESTEGEKRVPIKFLHTGADGPEWGNDGQSVQNRMGTRIVPAPIKDWAGQSGNSYPPDPSGAAGPNHYVQAVNVTPVKIFNKHTGVSLAAFSLGSLWSPAAPNAGDPIVMYDRFADRWFIAQFATFPSNNVYIAISKTPDPTGQYYTWIYDVGTYPDYLKFSIWNDGYYMTINNTRIVFCFERSAMLLGDPTSRMISTNYISNDGPSGFLFPFCPLTGDADGQLPTSGPCPMIYPVDDGWGASADGIYLKEIAVIWGATPSIAVSNGSLIPTFAHDMSSDSTRKDIPQPNGIFLDGVGGICWYRAQWRQWTGYNTLLCVFGVKISATQRSIKWVEMRQIGGVWTKYQEGIYSPDTKIRWVASIAMDDLGNIGLSYARASAATGDFASCAYTGRLKTDPLGQMTVAEILVPGGKGLSAQSSNPRYGDYSHTTVDPVNGCVFWSTAEYLSGGFPKTRIWSYQIENCLGIGIQEPNERLSEYVIYQVEKTLIVDINKLITTQAVQIDLFDSNGKLISSKKITPTANSVATTIDISSLSPGSYLVRVGNLEFQKVVKKIIY